MNTAGLPIVGPLSSVPTERVGWLFDGLIAKGKVTNLQGHPGKGKSMIGIRLAACVSTGCDLDGTVVREPGTVIYLSREDSNSDTVVPRLMAAGADLTRIAAVLEDAHLVSLPANLSWLASLVDDWGAELVIIDPLVSFLGVAINSNREQSIRRVLDGLNEVAEKTGASILIIQHLNKSKDHSAIERGLGSMAYVASPRIVLQLESHPTESEVQQISTIKNNIGRWPKPVTFKIVDAPPSAIVKFLGSIDDELESPSRRVGQKQREAESWLGGLLARSPVPATEILTLLETKSFSENTLKRAKKELGVISTKVGDGWVWSIADETVAGEIPGDAAMLGSMADHCHDDADCPDWEQPYEPSQTEIDDAFMALEHLGSLESLKPLDVFDSN